MEESEYEWLMSENQRIEEKMVVDIYINCYGSEDAFFANHLSNLLQTCECTNECNSVYWSMEKKRDRNSFLSFKYVMIKN
jgi:hypothetical protein